MNHTSKGLVSLTIRPWILVLYRENLVLPEHRKYQHILWRPPLNDSSIDFELQTVTYGVSLSPYLVIRTLLQLVYDEGLHLPEASKLIRNFTYIDDFLAGSSSLEAGLCQQTELMSLLKLGGFELAKWPHVHPNKCDRASYVFPDTDISLKLLGVYWNPSNDCFSYHTMPFKYQFTKRSVLSCIA